MPTRLMASSSSIGVMPAKGGNASLSDDRGEGRCGLYRSQGKDKLEQGVLLTGGVV